MISEKFYLFVLIWIIIAILLVPILLKIKAPYGRYTTTSWGPLIKNRWGWFFMEAPSLLFFTYFFLHGNNTNIICWVISGLWIVHYFQRVFIFPFRIKTKGKMMPVLVMLMAIFFNMINGYINGYYLGNITNKYTISWLYDPRFIIGILLFITGMIINKQSDHLLRNLRNTGVTTYKIPFGGLYKYISSPNYLGEIIEWTGFALLCWNLPALAFCIWTYANLLPRSISHHKWYLSHFKEYPKDRKVLIPFIF